MINVIATAVIFAYMKKERILIKESYEKTKPDMVEVLVHNQVKDNTNKQQSLTRRQHAEEVKSGCFQLF